VVNDVTHDAAQATRDAVRLLNGLGVRPRLFAAERPSGHDLHYTGEDEAFARLARLNAAALRATGARRAVFSCPETMHAYRDLYPRALGEPLGVECVHLVTLFAEAVRGGSVTFRKPVEEEPPVAYHDSCRMGRALGLYEEPRRVLAAAGARLIELEHARSEALCCGVGAWQRCDPTSRQLRTARLGEARAAGAAVLISPCARCTTHFICQLCHDGAAPAPHSGETKIVDLATYLVSRLV
jgi:heterodisulfide reductase subunit D